MTVPKRVESNVIPIDKAGGAALTPALPTGKAVEVADSCLAPEAGDSEMERAEAGPNKVVAVAQVAARSAGRARAGLAKVASPPELLEERRPSLKDVAYYHWYGEQTGQETLGRVLTRTYALLVALPLIFVLYLVLWVVERFSRLAVTSALVGLLLLVL